MEKNLKSVQILTMLKKNSNKKEREMTINPTFSTVTQKQIRWKINAGENK